MKLRGMKLYHIIGTFGIRIPENTWHTIIIHEPSITFEAKTGKYKLNSEKSYYKR